MARRKRTQKKKKTNRRRYRRRFRIHKKIGFSPVMFTKMMWTHQANLTTGTFSDIVFLANSINDPGNTISASQPMLHDQID